MNDNVNKEITEEELSEITGGASRTKKTQFYICQACGIGFYDIPNKKWGGEPICPNCKKH